MALQTSGEITLQDIAYEFDDSAPHQLSEFYGVASGIPTSGEITASDFYGATASFYNGVIDGSARFEDGSSAYLRRTPSSTTNRRTFTISCWVKRGNLDMNQTDIVSQGYDGGENEIYFYTNGSIALSWNGSRNIVTNALYRDPSAWYHIVAAFDTTQGTASNRVKLYVNGEQVTSFSTANYPAQNTDTGWNTTYPIDWGRRMTGYTYFDGYIAEAIMVDGQQLTPTSFGETKSGVWIPKAYSGSYGTNGFRLDFGTSLTVDQSGNGNNFTANNMGSTDLMLDTPENNFAVMQANHEPDNFGAYVGLEEGNLKLSNPSNWVPHVYATMGVTSGKWYWEMYANDCDGTACWYGLTLDGKRYSDANHGKWRSNGANYTGSGFTSSNGVSISNGDVLGFALDADNGVLYFYTNGTGRSAAVTYTPSSQGTVLPAFQWDNSGTGRRATFNFGQDSTFAGVTTAGGNSDGNGYGDFKYSVPSGYLALCTANLPVATAVDPFAGNSPQDNFNAVTYVGTGTSISSGGLSVTGVGFQPDWVWTKKYNTGASHSTSDAVRGATKELIPNQTDNEYTTPEGIAAFLTDGFKVGNENRTGASGSSYVGWCWKGANGTASNTNGATTTTVSANTGAGISIITWTGSGGTTTLGHGLGQAPAMIICKARGQGSNWAVYHQVLGNTKRLIGNTADTPQTTAVDAWNNTSPTSTVFTVGGGLNDSGVAEAAWAFAEIEGFSKFGSYTGNGSTNGTFVYTGFRPAFVMEKNIDAGGWWVINDAGRNPINKGSNGDFNAVFWNDAGVDNTSGMDLLSNGFKMRQPGTSLNNSGNTYIYMAFAENPFKYANAR